MNCDNDNNERFSFQTGCFFLFVLAFGLSIISPLFIIKIINYFATEKIIELNMRSYFITFLLIGTILTTTLFITQIKIKNKKNGKDD